MLRQIFNGMCMGAADIIPGISGGTVAFIMGFYEDLLHSIKSFRIPFKNFEWKFLLATIIGIAISMVCMANFITNILNHEVYRIYLYSAFLGLILASVVICAKQVSKWHFRYIVAFVIGVSIAYAFTGVEGSFKSNEELYNVKIENKWDIPISNYSEGHLIGVTEKEISSMVAKGYIPLPPGFIVDSTSSWINPWIIFCGMVAISALLLPGVSGSYMLTILGMYPIVIAALADFVNKLDFDAFLILANLGIGIIVGAILFSRVISWLLDHYHQTTLSLLTGFLVGSLHIVWPFWTYAYYLNPLQLDKGPRLHPGMPYIPNDLYQLFISFLFVVSGFALVFIMERIKNVKEGEAVCRSCDPG